MFSVASMCVRGIEGRSIRIGTCHGRVRPGWVAEPEGRHRALQVCAEPLEPRRLLSTASLNTTTHELTVSGDAAADNISVQLSGTTLSVTDSTDSPSTI